MIFSDDATSKYVCHQTKSEIRLHFSTELQEKEQLLGEIDTQ
jgi:hypothetical protein